MDTLNSSLKMICPRCWGDKTDPDEVRNCVHCNPCKHCTGLGVLPDIQLSAHFKLSEMVISQTAIRKGIENVPSDLVIANLKYVCSSLLEPIRSKFGPITITSGYRSPRLNNQIGGSITSAHVSGMAADINPLGSVTKKQIVDWVISTSEIEIFDQIIFEGTWVHVAHNAQPNLSVPDTLYKPDRKEALMMFNGKYSPYNSNDPRVMT